MKLFGKPQPHALAALAVGAVLATAACSPASPGSSATTSTPSGTTTSASPTSGPLAASGTTSASGIPSEPGASATVGALVPGFPQTLIPVMPGATVVSSSFDKSATPATAALVGSIKSPTAEVVAFYTQAFDVQGFKAVPGDAVEGTASKDFLRGDQEMVNIAVVETAGVSTFTVGANVAAGSIK